MSGILNILTGLGGTVRLPPSFSRSSTHAAPTDSYAGIQLNSDGHIYATPTNASSLTFSDDLGLWLLSGGASLYEARMTAGGPDSWSGSGAGTWFGLGTTRQWYSVVLSTGSNDNAGPLEIRLASSGSVLATTGSLSCFAEVT